MPLWSALVASFPGGPSSRSQVAVWSARASTDLTCSDADNQSYGPVNARRASGSGE
jgi:hypothetical protein